MPRPKPKPKVNGMGMGSCRPMPIPIPPIPGGLGDVGEGVAEPEAVGEAGLSW